MFRAMNEPGHRIHRFEDMVALGCAFLRNRLNGTFPYAGVVRKALLRLCTTYRVVFIQTVPSEVFDGHARRGYLSVAWRAPGLTLWTLCDSLRTLELAYQVITMSDNTVVTERAPEVWPPASTPFLAPPHPYGCIVDPDKLALVPELALLPAAEYSLAHDPDVVVIRVADLHLGEKPHSCAEKLMQALYACSTCNCQECLLQSFPRRHPRQ